MLKQAILVRQDLKMDKGKMAVQVAHASVDAVLKSDRKMVQDWKEEGMKKIVMKVPGKKELIRYMQEAKDFGLKTALITDAAKTFFNEPTTTCLAIGPDEEEEIDKVTGKLKIL
ncbi:MAG: peptidyl-tRNA hydrolase Pth2 [Candidatus Woesearchaeota archaeon]